MVSLPPTLLQKPVRVAQIGRALARYAGGPRFEPWHALGAVAQRSITVLVERPEIE